MAEKVTISLEVDVSDLEKLSEEGDEAGKELESTFEKISNKASQIFDQQTFSAVSDTLFDLNEGFNDLLRESIRPLTRQLGVFGTALNGVLESFIAFKDAIVTAPIMGFAGAIAGLKGAFEGLLQMIPVVGDGLVKLSKQLPKLVTVFASLSTTVQGFIAGQLAVLPGLLGAVGVAVTGLATTLGRSLEDSFNRVAEIVAGTSVNLKELERQLVEIGSTVPENLDQVAKTMRTITKAGIRSEETIDDLTRTTVKLGRLADASFTQVGEQITNIATSFDLLGKNAGENVDAFANDIITVRNNTVAGVSEITTSLRRVASSASVLDVPVDQMLALTGAIQQAGQTARRSGTRLRRGFEEIVQTLSDVEGQRAFSELLGISTEQFRERIQDDVGSVIIDLANALGNSEENAKDFANTIDTLGTAGGTALTAVASKAGLLNELLNKMSDNTNSLQEATEETLSRFSQQFSILTDKITLFFKTVGLAFLQPFTDLVRNINDELDQARSRVLSFARVIKENLPNIKENISQLFGFEGEGFSGFNLDALKEQFNTVFKEVGNLFGDTVLTVIKAGFQNVLLPLAITFAKNSVAVFQGFFSTDFGRLVWSSLKFAFTKLLNFLNSTILPIFVEAGNMIVESIKEGLESIVIDIPYVGEVDLGIDEETNKLKQGVDAIASRLQKLNKNNEIAKTLTPLETTIERLNTISTLWSQLSDQQKSNIKGIIEEGGQITKIITDLQKVKETGTGAIPDKEIESLNQKLKQMAKISEDKALPALDQMSGTISDNMAETIFKLLDEGLFSDEQKQRIKNNSEEIARLMFGDEFVNSAKNSIKNVRDKTFDQLINEEGLDFKEALNLKFPEPSETKLVKNLNKFNKKARKRRKTFNQIMEVELPSLGDDVELGEFSRKLNDSIKNAISRVNFRDATKEARSDYLDASMEYTNVMVESAQFGLETTQETLDRIRDKKSPFDKFIQSIFDEFNAEISDDRLKNVAKSYAKGINSTLASEIESQFLGQDFDFGKAIAKSFAQTISQDMANELSKQLGLTSLSEDLARSTVNFLSKPIGNIANQLQEQVLKPAGNAIKDAVLNTLEGIFNTIANNVSAKKVGNLVSNTASGLMSLFGFAKGGQVPEFASGGQVSGQGGIDQIMAMLSRGEFVVRREAVNSQTLPFLKQLNENGPKMRKGGMAGGNTPNMNNGSNGEEKTVIHQTINNEFPVTPEQRIDQRIQRRAPEIAKQAEQQIRNNTERGGSPAKNTREA